MASDLSYVATLNNEQVLKALQSIDKNIDKMAGSADKNFNEIGKSANLSGVQIGAISGVVSSLVTEFINLGQQAISTLIDIGKQSVETAIQVDTLKARLGGIFRGNKEAADEAFTFIQKKSKELGIDLSELAGAFIPKTENLAQFERVAKIATALARSDPEQGAIGARIALIEALSGTFTSLQRRFEIPKQDIDRLKEAFDTKGMEGFITEFEKVLKESGKGFEDLANTAQTSFDKLAIAGEQLGGRLGAPILEALQAAADKIGAFATANEDDLIVLVDTIGRTVADVINLISSVDLSGLDIKGLIEFADYLQRIVAAAQLLGGQLGGLSPIFADLLSVFAPLSPILDTLYNALLNIDDAFVVAAQTTAIAKASYEGLKASLDPLIEALGYLTKAAAQSASFNYTGAVESLGAAAGAIQNNVESQAAFNASLAESQAAFDNYKKSVDTNKDSQAKLREELEKSKTAGTEAADAIQAKGAADRQAADDAQALADAQTKVNEETAKAEQDFQRKLEDIDIATERKRLDIAIEFAGKREDAAKNNLRKLEDIQKKSEQDIKDASKDYLRKQEDAVRKYWYGRFDLERESRQKIVDVETNYRRTLQGIQSQFLTDTEEAERNRDAVSFLRALKERDKKVSEAQQNRAQEIADAKTTQELKRQELDIQAQRELEEAGLANERKLEDLRTNLNRQIEEQNTAYARQLEDLAMAEQQKNDELALSRERDIEDAKKAYDRKLEDLKISLASEYDLIAQNNAAIEEEARRHLSVMEEIAARQTKLKAMGIGSAKNTPTHPAAGSGQAQGPHPGAIPGFATGGVVPFTPGKQIVVGEGGPELVKFGRNALQILPSEGLRMNTLTPGGAYHNVNNSRSQQINLPLASPESLLTPVFVAQLRNMIQGELSKVI